MSLLSISRLILISLFAIGAFLFSALPGPSSIQHRVSVLGPSVAWAGSPDETLNPPPVPPKKSAQRTIVRPGVTSVSMPARALLATLWRVYWATVRL
jgi:hypothetical protein